ncbi:MAG: hypothetical protein AAGD05_15285, partial [Bacteroidota bacterium]
MTRFFCFLLLLGFCSKSTLAQTEALPFKTKSISVFKNNTAFLLKSGEVSTQQGHFKMTQAIPTALYGTLWIHSPDNRLKNVQSFEETITKTEQRNAQSINSMIQANLNKRMKIVLSNEQVHEGRVENLHQEHLPVTSGGRPLTSPILMTFKTDSSWLSLPLSEVKRVWFQEKPNFQWEKTSQKTQHVVQVDFTNQAAKQKLDLIYLTAGINWAPMYLLELQSPTSAQLTLRGELSNEAEDIVNAD